MHSMTSNAVPASRPARSATKRSRSSQLTMSRSGVVDADTPEGYDGQPRTNRTRRTERTVGCKEGQMNIRHIPAIGRSLALGALMLLPILVAACSKGSSGY